MKTSASSLVLAFVFCFAAHAQTNALEATLRANSYAFKIEKGSITGPAAAFLDGSMTGVQFVAFGEEHSRRAVHQFAGALFRMLQSRHGFQYLALEEDPYLGQLASEAGRKRGAEGLIALAKRYPNAFHLLTEEELTMIGDIARSSNAPTAPVWGLNQVFGATHIYERLVEIAPNAAAKDVARSMLERALEYEAERFQQNKSYVAQVSEPADFVRLREAFRAASGSEAARLIEQVELSHRIFKPYWTVPRPPPTVFHQSGRLREANMKHLFADQYRAAQRAGVALPKVMAMFGQLHLYRGLSPRTDLFTLGNFLSELAVFNRMSSLQLYTATRAPEERYGWRAPLMRVASETVGENDGVVVDLRPLVPLARDRAVEMDEEVRRLIFGFDVFLFLNDPAAGSVEKLRTPKFRMYPDEPARP